MNQHHNRHDVSDGGDHSDNGYYINTGDERKNYRYGTYFDLAIFFVKMCWISKKENKLKKTIIDQYEKKKEWRR